MTAAKISVVVAAVVFAITLASLANGHSTSHSSAWKYGYQSGKGAISGCNQEAQNLVTMNVLGYDDWDDYVAGCKAAQVAKS